MAKGKTKDTKKDVKAKEEPKEEVKAIEEPKKKEEPKKEDTTLVQTTEDVKALKGESSKIIKIGEKKRLPMTVFSKGVRKNYNR